MTCMFQKTHDSILKFSISKNKKWNKIKWGENDLVEKHKTRKREN